VASLFCQHVQPVLSDGRSWDDHREEVADLMIATVDRYAPGFQQSVLGRQIRNCCINLGGIGRDGYVRSRPVVSVQTPPVSG
jgi:hypothetical protein